MINISASIDPTNQQSLTWAAGFFQVVATYCSATPAVTGSTTSTTSTNPDEGTNPFTGSGTTTTPTPTPSNQTVP